MDRSKRATNPDNFNEDGTIKRGFKLGWNYSNKYIKVRDKLKAKGGRYLEVNTHKVKASQFNHLNQEYNRKKLSKRWNYLEYEGSNIKIQRDIYSAYLIKHVKEDLETIDNDKCIINFDKFLEFHNKEIERLQGLNNLSSMGI